jgi:hypothetical protein
MREQHARATQSAIERELHLAQATHCLRIMRRNALTGGRYDPEEFDAAVLRYRDARRRARAIRLRRKHLSDDTGQRAA